MSYQYLRKWSLIVAPLIDSPGIDLSELHFKFTVKRGDIQTPNSTDITIYNLDAATAKSIKTEYSQVILQAGYQGLPAAAATPGQAASAGGTQSNYGVIFTGFVNQRRLGKETPVDSFVGITADDGGYQYNFAVINASLAAGSKTEDHVNQVATAMGPGVTLGTTPDFTGTGKPRGKVMFGMARDVMRDVANTAACTWSIQDGKIVMSGKTTYNPGPAVKLTSLTGMIGFPEQTFGGIHIRCLLNSNLKINSLVQIDEASLQALKFPLDLQGSVNAKAFAPQTQNDGLYKVIYAEHTGDNRGQEWYTDLICLAVDSTVTPPSLYPKITGVAPAGPVKQYG